MTTVTVMEWQRILLFVDGRLDRGITVTEARARDLMLPGELRRAAQDTLLARERGRADLERARAEAASLRMLANAARVLEEHPSLLHLRTLQVAAEPGTRIVLDPRGD